MQFTMSTFSLPARLLGALFYYSPENAVFSALRPTLSALDSLFDWPQEAEIKRQQQILQHTVGDEELAYQFSVLFEGQGYMPAPPWGSVYLDKENLLMGESLLRYRAFLLAQELKIDTGLNEPEDQFGLMLMAFALLLETDQLSAACTLLSEHLMPWANRYLTLLTEQTVSPFYQALAEVAHCYLAHVTQQLEISICEYRLYR